MELLRALAVFSEPPGREQLRIAAALELPAPSAADHTDLFVLQLVPYASIYVGGEGMIGGEARDRVAGFWRALGLVPPAEPDHLAALLGLYAALADDEAAQTVPARAALRRQARAALLHEHLLSWLDPWLAKLSEIAPPAYLAWGNLLTDALRVEAQTVLYGGEPLPAHLRAAAPLEGPERTGGQAFLAALLAPARSGLVLVRDDLARAAGDLGLGARVAERRYVLRHLLGQDPAGTLGWLEAEAGRAARRPAVLAAPSVAAHWKDRATATADVLQAARAATTTEVIHAG
jgi:TorA maturation chaperone TorD